MCFVDEIVFFLYNHSVLYKNVGGYPKKSKDVNVEKFQDVLFLNIIYAKIKNPKPSMKNLILS